MIDRLTLSLSSSVPLSLRKGLKKGEIWHFCVIWIWGGYNNVPHKHPPPPCYSHDCQGPITRYCQSFRCPGRHPLTQISLSFTLITVKHHLSKDQYGGSAQVDLGVVLSCAIHTRCCCEKGQLQSTGKPNPFYNCLKPCYGI
jgi:hypothetical protein